MMYSVKKCLIERSHLLPIVNELLSIIMYTLTIGSNRLTIFIMWMTVVDQYMTAIPCIRASVKKLSTTIRNYLTYVDNLLNLVNRLMRIAVGSMKSVSNLMFLVKLFVCWHFDGLVAPPKSPDKLFHIVTDVFKQTDIVHKLYVSQLCVPFINRTPYKTRPSKTFLIFHL